MVIRLRLRQRIKLPVNQETKSQNFVSNRKKTKRIKRWLQQKEFNFSLGVWYRHRNNQDDEAEAAKEEEEEEIR